ncbi:LysE family translocator [Chelativorans salis]|uniref:LysE family translocator n=1 Tax=Chelativorans salis TaxID=2978478 RepID=A0ABT2LQJ0_9HYPH|nr:LysE family translocator [Chelativorans sp. EGI FJ00035]MCT7376606.1 LysE family translocator [Chelativorans sp. EGI FJ00035]
MSIEFLVTSLIVILIPGTGVVYTVATGLAAGRRASFAAAFGCTLGILPALFASVVGLAALLHTSALLFQVIKLAGVAYLLYLAWQTLKEAGPLRINAGERRPLAAMAIVRTGFLINILNPKLSLFFLAFLPQFIVPAAGSVSQMLILGAVFMAMTFAVFLVYGGFAALVGEKVLRSETVMKWMRRATAAAFAGFGLRLAFADR